MGKSPRKSVADSSDFSSVAGAHRTCWEREREGTHAGRALNKDARATRTMATDHGAVSPDGEVRGGKSSDEKIGQGRTNEGRVGAGAGDREGKGN